MFKKADEIIGPENFRSLFHYYGVLSMAERREGLTYFKVPALSSGTRLHLILYQFKGTELIRCEEIPQETCLARP